MGASASIRALRRPGTWLILAALVLLWLPVLGVWLGSQTAPGSSLLTWLSDAPYVGALRRSLNLVAWLVGIGMLIGWPAGVWLGLHQFRGRRLFIGSLCLPLLLPPFLVSIALSFLRPWLPYAWQDIVDGLPGCVLTGCQLVLPMAIASAMWVSSQLTEGERAAALFAGGAANAVPVHLPTRRHGGAGRHHARGAARPVGSRPFPDHGVPRGRQRGHDRLRRTV